MEPHSFCLLLGVFALLLMATVAAFYVRYRHLKQAVVRMSKEQAYLFRHRDDLLYLSDGYEEVYAGMQYRLRNVLVEMKALSQIMQQHYDLSPLGFDREYFALLNRAIKECERILDEAQEDGHSLMNKFGLEHHMQVIDLLKYMKKHAARVRRQKETIQIIVDTVPTSLPRLSVWVDRYFLDKVMHNIMGHMLKTTADGCTISITLTDNTPEQLVEIKVEVLGAKPARNGKGKRLFSSENESELYAAHHYIMALCGKVYYSENSDKELAFFFNLPKAVTDEKIRMMTALLSF